MTDWAIAPSQAGLDSSTLRARGIPPPDLLTFVEGEVFPRPDGIIQLVVDTQEFEMKWDYLGATQLLALRFLLDYAISKITGLAWIRVDVPVNTGIARNWQDYQVALSLGNTEPTTRTGQAVFEQVILKGAIQ